MDSLAQEKLTLERFLEVLKEEEGALIEGDTALVMKLADQKMACADALQASRALNEALTQEREAHALHPLVQAAHTQNLINGRLIEDRLKTLRLSLTRLEQLAPQKSSSTVYGKDGNSSTFGPRSFGSA